MKSPNFHTKPKYALTKYFRSIKKKLFLSTSQNHSNATHFQQKMFVIKVDRECRLLAGGWSIRCDALEKATNFLPLYSRLKKVPERDLKLKIFIRMIAEIVSLRCALSFSVREAAECKKLSKQWENCSRRVDLGGNKRCYKSPRPPCRSWLQHFVEVAPRKARATKAAEESSPGYRCQYFPDNGRAMSELWPDHWLCVSYWKVYGVKIKTTLFPSLNGFSSFSALFHRALKQIPRSHRRDLTCEQIINKHLKHLRSTGIRDISKMLGGWGEWS